MLIHSCLHYVWELLDDNSLIYFILNNGQKILYFKCKRYLVLSLIHILPDDIVTRVKSEEFEVKCKLSKTQCRERGHTRFLGGGNQGE